jgi:hypothetical protein
MWIEATRLVFLVFGGIVAVSLAVLPRLACRFYAEAVVTGRDRQAGFWAFLAAGGGAGAGHQSGRRRHVPNGH